jgi:FkbM family methyltransferase
MLTYAQNFEDVMLERLFQKQATGFYIDVGAWDPTKHSVTKHFYDKNWRGINIEPIERQFKLFEESRPEDINLNLAVGESVGTLTFFECVTDTALSTMDAAQAKTLSQRGFEIQKYKVEVTTLQRIIDERCSTRDIDFLKIDVEGWERQVLMGLDFRRSSPRVLVIEATKPATPIVNWDDISKIERWQSWEGIVTSAGYEFAYYDGLSRFYLRADIAHLRGRLGLPPGIYDAIEYPQVRELSEKLVAVDADRQARLGVIDRLDAQLRFSERERAKDVEHLTGELASVESDRKARQETIERLTARLQESERDREARLEVIVRLERQLEELERGRAVKLETIERLDAQLKESERDRAARLEIMERLGAQLKESERDRAARLDVIERLDAQLREPDRDPAARLEMIDSYNAKCRALEQGLAGEVEANERLQERLEETNGELRKRNKLLEEISHRLTMLKAYVIARTLFVRRDRIALDIDEIQTMLREGDDGLRRL